MLDWLFRKRREQRARPSISLVLYTRPDCGLCDVMKAQIVAARLETPYSLEEIDISGDPELERSYGESIPVLHIAGRLAFKGRLSAAALERKFARFAGAQTQSGPS